MSITPNSKATGVPCLCLCLPGFPPLWSVLHKNPDSLGWMSYCTWNKSSDNTHAPKFLFGLKEKKKESKLVPVMFALGWATKIKPRGCDCLRFYFLLICGSDRTGFSSDSCGNWCQQSSNPGKNPPLPLGMLQLSLDAALESTWDFSLRNLLLRDLLPVNSHTIRGLKTKMLSRSWNSFHVGGNFSQYL